MVGRFFFLRAIVFVQFPVLNRALAKYARLVVERVDFNGDDLIGRHLTLGFFFSVSQWLLVFLVRSGGGLTSRYEPVSTSSTLPARFKSSSIFLLLSDQTVFEACNAIMHTFIGKDL